PEEPLALLEMRGFVLARTGREAEARAILKNFEVAQQQGKSVEMPLATIYVGLKDYDKVLDILERIQATERDDARFLCDPLTDELRDLPRYKALLERSSLKGHVG